MGDTLQAGAIIPPNAYSNTPDRPNFGSVDFSVGTTYAPTQSLMVKCTVAGNVAVTMADGSVLVIPVPTGLTQLDLSISKVNTSGTTATATYAGLY